MFRGLFFLTLIFSLKLFGATPPEKPSDWDNWTFSQKVIWRGVNLDPRIPYGPLVDKLLVKKVVQNDISVATTFFATDDPSKISIEDLPSSFIMKANNASGRGILVKNGIVIATKKREENFIPIQCTDEFLRSYAEFWLKDPYEADREKQYALVKPMILFEEFFEDVNMDIEFYFFNGKARLVTLFFIEDYEKKPVVSYYDENWNIIQATHPKHTVKNEPIEKPFFFEKLLAFGERFAEKVDHVRIDFFVTKNDIYFGEFTFTTGGGSSLNHLNAILGNTWDFPDPRDPLANSYLDERLKSIE